jgi:uncharacterized protein YqeY
MTMQERLLQDLHQAIRDRDASRKSALRLLRAAIANEESARQSELSEDQVMVVLRQEVRKHKESLAEFEKAGRNALAAEERAQLSVLMEYMPPQMGRQEIEMAAKAAIEEAQATTPAEFGAVMRVLMPRLKGKADGALVSQIVRERLAGGGSDVA